MPRNFIKRWTPTPERVRKIRGLRFLGRLLDDPYIFHLNRRSVSVAFFVGLFICFLPILGQIPLAAVAALVFRCNLPITLLLVWISNPFTFPFIYFACYRFGALLLRRPVIDVQFDLSWQWFTTTFQQIWEPFVLGSLIASLFFGCLGYVSVQWFWRWRVRVKWRTRRQT